MKNTIIKALIVLLSISYLIHRKNSSLNGVDLLVVELVGLIGFEYLKLKL